MNRRLTMAEWAVAVFGTNPLRAAFVAGDSGAPDSEQVVVFEAAMPKFDLWGMPMKETV